MEILIQINIQKNIKDSLLKSLALNTKLSNEIKFMSGMSGRKYRYFIAVCKKEK